MDQRLGETNGVLCALAESISDYAVYMLDPQGQILTWNSGAEKITGYMAAEAIGRNHGMLCLPEHAAEMQEAMEKAVTSGRHELEGWRLRKDGHRFYASTVLNAICNEKAELLGVVSVMRDLTESQRLGVWFKHGLESAPTAMLMVNNAGIMAAVNAETERLFGYERGELIGQPIEMLMPAQYRDGHPGLRKGYLERPKVHMMARGRDLHAQHKDGSQFPVEISLNPVQTEKGVFVLGSVVDLTERKAHEAYIKAALTEKEVLLREVYHRVKNNLQVIQSLLSLRSRTLPEGLARSVMLESVQRVRAMALVHEKLYQSDNLERISLPDYVGGLFRQLMEAYGRQTQQGQVKLYQEIAAVNIGLDRAVPLGLLLTELISNCLKHGFVDGRPGEVHVSLRETEEGLRLSVADNGIGVPDGANPLEGKSMGLTLVVSLSQQLNGRLGWHPGPGGTGLEFVLDMPAL